MSDHNNTAPDDESTDKIQEPETERKAGGRQVHINVESVGVPVGRIALGTAVVLGVLFLAYVVYTSLSILLLLFFALLVATAIEPIVNMLRRGPFSRSAGILIVYTGLFIVLGVIGYILVTVFVSQLGAVGNSLQASIMAMQTSVKTMDNNFVRQELDSMLSAALNLANSIFGASGTSKSTDPQVATTAAITVAEVFFGVVTIFVVAFYWLSERTLIKRSLMSWLPASRANRVRRVWDDIEIKVGGWVRGQLTLMLIVGLLSAVGYFVLGVSYWPALALFIGIAEAVPLVGPYIGTAPAVLVALTQPGNDGLPSLLGLGDFGNLTRALMVVVFAIILQTIEGNVLIPRIMKNSVGISALTVIISLLLGATLVGLAGALIAVPVAGMIQVILADFKAAKESDQALAEKTASSAETRLEQGDLVVAYGGDGTTKTVVESKT
jgi:predicted PurR-regulated permease PerM